MKIAWPINAARFRRLVIHAMRDEHTTLCNIPVSAKWQQEETDLDSRITCMRCHATMDSPLADKAVPI